MDRREFFKKSILAGIAAGAAMTFGDFKKTFAGKVPPQGPPGPWRTGSDVRQSHRVTWGDEKFCEKEPNRCSQTQYRVGYFSATWRQYQSRPGETDHRTML